MFKLFKGLSLCLIFVIINLITVKVNAADAYFVWEKTTIDVPVYEDLEEYKDDYIVKLYVNGVLSNDFYVEMEVNCTTFSTVLTHIVGKYTVYYKAYSKNNYLSDEVAIVFNVVDITAPTLNLYSDIVEVNYGLSLKDINWYSVYDDTCSIDDIKIDIDDKNVIYNTTGTYSAMIVATDIYGNSSKESFTVKVIDEIKPSILVLKPLVFNYGEDVVIRDYFMCNDNYNNDITHRLKLYNLDTKKLGNQEITLKAKDYSNNETIVILDVVVVDLIPPTLVLSYQEVMLDIYNYNEYNVDFFNNYIFSLTDNYSKPVNIILTIDCSLLQEEVADYNVYYTATDENDNKIKHQLVVKLREFIGPEIICEDVVKVKLGSNVDLLSLVEVFDKYDSNAISRLSVISDGFDISILGSYEVKYTCFNTSGIFTEKTVTIIVEEDIENVDEIEVKEPVLDVNLLIIIGACLLGVGCIVVVIVYKKRKNK